MNSRLTLHLLLCSRRALVATVVALPLAGCGTTDRASPPQAPAMTTSTQRPLSPAEFASIMAGQPDDFPSPPDQQHRDGYLAALRSINLELTEDRAPDALVNRGLDQCRDLKERPSDEWLTWVNTRFTSPEHPNGFDDVTAGKVLAAVRKYICPTF
jgi:hypothetical protein